YGIGEKELAVFSASAIMMGGINDRDKETVFVIPFPLKEKDLSVICYSFVIADTGISDTRKAGKTSAVYSVILLTFLLPKLGNLNRKSFVHQKEFENHPNIQTLGLNGQLFDITFETMRRFALHLILTSTNTAKLLLGKNLVRKWFLALRLHY
ncbi:MAG TPA: hypothetical protein VJ044_10065, partial [Candidatus Hodarchaeales archaeon]|nr:hypothetical protein [Candidatus Hodarchaeales archaeon]